MATTSYGQSIDPAHARVWGLARCGHHDFSDGRSARHRGVNLLDFVLLPLTLSLDTLFSTEPHVNATRGIARNVAFVAHVCLAAAACEM